MTAKFPRLVLPLTVAVVFLAATPSAFANTITTDIAFQCTAGGQPGAYYGAGTLVSNPTGSTCVAGQTGHVSVASFTQAEVTGASLTPTGKSYTVTMEGGKNPGGPAVSERVNGSNNVGGATANGSLANYYQWGDNPNQGFTLTSPYPASITRVAGVPTLSNSVTGSNQADITYSGGKFDLDDFYLSNSAADTNISYAIYGYSGSTMVYCIAANSANAANGVTCTAPETFTAGEGMKSIEIIDPDSGIAVTSVFIDDTASAGDNYLDNIVVNNTPEPSGLLLLGTGLLGLAFALRKRLAA